MSVADDFVMNSTFVPGPIPTTPCPRGSGKSKEAKHTAAKPTERKPSGDAAPRPLHRVARVRQQQGVSVRSAARRMGVPMQQVREEEQPDRDLTASQLQRWQRALEVPMADLLVDNDAPISAPVLKRAKWLRLMKTVKALIELDASDAATRMAQMLEAQVLEVMPELTDVGAWHTVGQRRTQDEMGRVVSEVVPRNFARDGLR